MNTKICNDCKEKKDFSEYAKNGLRNGVQRFRGECKVCYATKQRQGYRNKKVRYKELLLEHFGSLDCGLCGYAKCFAALDLHHIDPKTKDHSISRLMNYTETRILIEIEKCELICSNCHRELHSKDA